MTEHNTALHLGKSGCSHLNPAFIRSVDLQVMSICAVQTQQTTTRKTCIVTCEIETNHENALKLHTWSQGHKVLIENLENYLICSDIKQQ